MEFFSRFVSDPGWGSSNSRNSVNKDGSGPRPGRFCDNGRLGDPTLPGCPWRPAISPMFVYSWDGRHLGGSTKLFSSLERRRKWNGMEAVPP
jgi:hypothetical protein